MADKITCVTSCLIVAGAFVVALPSSSPGAPPQDPGEFGTPSGLPLPGESPLQDYETKLYTFLFKRSYAKPPHSWRQDKEIRDTGPFVGGLYYGTHPAVRVYYSPEVMTWLQGDRKAEIADGGMIIKEMFPAPAGLYVDPIVGASPKKDAAAGDSPLDGLISAWTVMVKDRSVAKGGWFYSNPAAPDVDIKGMSTDQFNAAVAKALDNYGPPFDFPASGSGLGTCQRCHASAANELTFSSLDNVLGYSGQPLRFRNDDTWRDPAYLAQLPSNVRDFLGIKDAAPTGRLAAAPQLSSPAMLSRQLRARTDIGVDSSLQQLGASGLHGPQARRAMRLKAAMPSPFMDLIPPPNPDFIATFHIDDPTLNPKKFPGQWADRVEAGPNGAGSYITSDNCLGCHGGLGGAPYGLTMFYQTDPDYGHGYNISEYGEWRWSPMGLAGRDPIFYAQTESEAALIDASVCPDDPKAPRDPNCITKEQAKDIKLAMFNLCASCHGAMGQRQLELDVAAGKPLDPVFKKEYVDLTTYLSKDDPKQPDYEYHKYGNLAREGVSCAICHHIDPPDPQKVKDSKLPDLDYFLMNNLTGHFNKGPDNVLNGPFDKVAVVPMQVSLGVTPKVSKYIKDSRVCGTCHAINLPNVDAKYPGPFKYLDDAEPIEAFKKFPHSIEQATFLEWKNSVFADETPGNKAYQSCQDCHMPAKLVLPDRKISQDPLITQIATIEDTTYPMADHGAPADALHVPVRGDYRRHELVGLNVFLEMMFGQFESTLGVSKEDPMTGPFDKKNDPNPYNNRTNGNVLAIANMVRQAKDSTVDVTARMIPPPVPAPNRIAVEVTVTNKVGHRFPSGVGFRRAFLEVVATLKSDPTVVAWGSGRTNHAGVIVGGDGKPLASEFLPDAKTYQPHYQEINAEDQVQIYEELTLNAKNEFNTSFVHRDSHPKDNRLLARGWRSGEHLANQTDRVKQFMEATGPEGASVLPDPDYGDNDGKGASGADRINYVINLPAGVDPADVTVSATMYYQSIPPFYLQERFKLAPKGPATQRLYFLASRLQTKGTPIEDWKLPLVGCKVDAVR